MREKPQAAYILSDNLHINYNLCNNNGDTIIVCNISYIYYTHILVKYIGRSGVLLKTLLNTKKV